MPWDIRLPSLLNALVVVQVELAIDDPPCLWIGGGCVALGDRPGAISAILRGVARRLGRKPVAVLGRGKAPGRAVPVVGEV